MCQKGTGELDGKQLPGTCESELVILLGIHSEVTADLSPVSTRTRRGRWVDCGVERQSGKWNRQLENPFAIAFFLRNHRGKVLRSGPVSPTQSSVFSQHSVTAQSNPFTASPRDRNHRFHRQHCQGPFLQKRGRQIAFNDLIIITQEICLFLYLVAVFFSIHLSLCSPSHNKSRIPWTAIHWFSGCCG